MSEKVLLKEKIEDRQSRVDVPGYRNPGLSVKERTQDLLHRMTVEEKIAQMLCIWGQKRALLFDEEGKLSFKNLRAHFKLGVGQIARLSDTGGAFGATGGTLSPAEMAELANKIQKFFVEETRLGIPVIFHEECLHGLAAKDATSYPQPIGLASTFDPELLEEIYAAIAEDARLRGVHQALTPVVDIAREPRWGRVEETFGEDPYLVSRMGIAAVKGFQGDGTFKDKKHIIATLKHFAAHGQPESGSNCGPVNVSERLLRDAFLYPFKEVIQKAKVKSVMASYNEIDGVPSHANRWLLRDVLRGEWGFDGYVVSDYYAITELNSKDDTHSHGVAKDKREAAVLAANAGVNIELPDPDCYPSLKQLVQEGKIAEEVVDELVASLLKYKFELGLFEDPYVDPGSIKNEIKLEKDRPLALRAASETITLLKNENDLLPLDLKKYKSIAVIGPNADRTLIGGYSGTPKYFVSVLGGITEKVGANARVLYSEGCKITIGGSWNEDKVTFANPEDNRKLIAEAVETAKKSDVVVLVLGDNEQTSREAWSKVHLGDRANLNLFGMQEELARAIVETGKPVVVLLFNGRPISIGYIAEHIPAILECWYLGQEAGRAAADVLFGDCNPGGKLPISVPRSSGHVPCYYNRKPSARRGYLDDDITPLFPFGYGLSYTRFKFNNLRLEKATILPDESAKVFVDVTNAGRRTGDEVVQLYIHDVISSVTRPVKELKGFERIRVEPGATKTVALTISPELLAFTNIDMEHVVEPGDFEIMVGNSSRDEDLSKIILHVL
ncbi:MAG TPA: glycoside hydrolase family 3 N-terminal domain-containing protein [Candidatus Acidoferrales bacterium]|nr:glycoside hydrolase family 3 N-terminal domain-containing protein [Candidatus Acidoferrales bacterium]